MDTFVHRWTRLLMVPVIAGVALLGLTDTASAEAASATSTTTTGTTALSVDTFTDACCGHYSNTGTLLSGQVTIKPRTVFGSGQIAGANGGWMHFSLYLFRSTTT